LTGQKQRRSLTTSNNKKRSKSTRALREKITKLQESSKKTHPKEQEVSREIKKTVKRQNSNNKKVSKKSESNKKNKISSRKVSKQKLSKKNKADSRKISLSKKINKRKELRKKRRAETDLQKEDRVVKKVVRSVSLIVILAIVVVSTTVFFYVKSNLAPLNPQSENLISVKIPLGASNRQIAGILQNKKIIKNATMFNYLAKFKNYGSFKSGYYNLKASYALEKIAKILKKGGANSPFSPIYGKIVIKEGQDIDEIAKQIEINVNTKSGQKTPFKSAEFLNLMGDDNFFEKMAKKYPKLLGSAAGAQNVRYKLEGYLYPATYDYGKNDTIKELVQDMIATANQVLTPYYSRIAKSHLSVHEVLTLSSLVEKEAREDDDRRLVAQVFLNRLKIDMPLQTDISVLYALRESKADVTVKDTHVDSPYNLYQNKGLGAGPFCAPSKMSIEAVLDPKETDDLYFVADVKTGKVYFSKTYEEHEKLAAKYVNN